MADGTAPAIISTAVLAMLGAILGSFIATIAVRWPQGRSVLRGRSMCDGCGRPLRVGELVPLLSAIRSRGRCRTCDAAIDPLHWRIELVAAAIGAAAGVVAGGSGAVAGALAGAMFGWLLLLLAALDLVAWWLPDRVTATLALAGVASGMAGLAPALPDRLIGGAGGFALLWAVARGYRLLRGREGMGGGDPKLFGAIGLWLGWRPLPLTLVAAAAIGLAIALVGHGRGRAMSGDTAMPFGALLAVAAYPVWLVMIG